MAHENAGVVLRVLEGDAVAEERHLMVAGVVVEPEVVEAVAGGLALVGGVADIEHDGGLRHIKAVLAAYGLLFLTTIGYVWWRFVRYVMTTTAARRRVPALFIAILVNTHVDLSQNLTTKLLKIAYGVSSVCDFMNI